MIKTTITVIINIRRKSKSLLILLNLFLKTFKIKDEHKIHNTEETSLIRTPRGYKK